MSQKGRPPKAGRGDGSGLADLLPVVFGPRDGWLFEPEWLMAAVSTVQGVADAALVDRRTVLRAGIKPGSVGALFYVRDERRKKWRPLSGPGTGFDWRNATPEFLSIVGSVRSIRAALDAGPKSFVQVKGGRPSKRTRNTRHLPVETDARIIAEAEGATGHHYQPSGKVTVEQLCALRKISRRGFYKWLESLPAEARAAVRAEMGNVSAAPLLPVQRVTSKAGASRLRSYLGVDVPDDFSQFDLGDLVEQLDAWRRNSSRKFRAWLKSLPKKSQKVILAEMDDNKRKNA